METRFGVAPEDASLLGSIFGISGVCNLLGAIKTAKHYGLGKKRRRGHRSAPTTSTATGASWSGSRRRKARWTRRRRPPGSRGSSTAPAADWIQEGTVHNRNRWHNLKYYTWVEQQGKTVEELDAQRDPGWWIAHQKKAAELDEGIRALRR